MKTKYETPTAEKLEFNYSDMVAASNIKTKGSKDKKCNPSRTEASNGPKKCD